MQTPQPQGASDLDVMALLLLRRHVTRVREAGCPLLLALRSDPSGEWCAEVVGYGLELLGYSATSDVDALGLVATGRVRPLDSAVELTGDLAAASAAYGIDLACVVCRNGAVAWKAFAGAEALQMPAPDDGLLLDCLRRSLGASTPPPKHSPALLEGPLWAARLAAVARGSAARLSWAQVEACRPPAPPKPPQCTGSARAEALRATWEHLRVAAGAGGVTSVWFPRREHCEWMDAGMFSRWVVASIPSPTEMAAALRSHLEPQAARRFYHELTRIVAG
jgi:hypothetical protein